VNGRVSYWLIPAEPHKHRWAQIIRDLAQRFEAPEFEPHVTLYSGPQPSGNMEDILAHAAKSSSQIVLQTIGLAHSTEFTKTLFVEFSADERLTKLSEDLRRLSTPSSPYELKPHLSLVYAPLHAKTRERLTREFSLPATINFNEVKAIATGAVARSRADVEAWRIMAEKKLS